MPQTELQQHVLDPARLKALKSVALLDTPAEQAFDRLSWLASQFLDAPVALVSLVDAERQYFKSCIGLPEPWNSQRQTPLSHSFCQHNRTAGQPMVINDAREDALLRNNLAIRDLNVIAYLGFPLTTEDGYVLGSFCVIDSVPREWSEKDILIIQELAASVMTEIHLRSEIAERRHAEQQRDDYAELNQRLRREIAAREHAEAQHRSLESQLLQTQKLDALGRLAGGISHDLNNLLAPILGYSELLSERLKHDEKLQGYAREIMLSGERARDLIRHLLAYSRKQTLEFRPLNINHVIQGFSSLLRRTIPEDIEIRTQLAPDICPVMADITQLEQIIMNLGLNAADAMPDGGVLTLETSLLDIESDAELAPGRYMKMSVNDSGCGMDEETQQHIFEPFFSTKGERGTGLGLATVFGIVKQHGGNVLVDSTPGVGTRFDIYLPITERVAQPVAINSEQNVELKGNETILLVEDNGQLRQMAQTILLLQGYKVLTAKDGHEALVMLNTHPDNIDLLLTDVVMPGMNGKQLYEVARNNQPGLKVIYMSGYSHDVIADRGALHGEVHFIQKPFSTHDLGMIVRKTLDES